MTEGARSFEFVVEHAEQGWMVLGGRQPIGPFVAREQAMDLALGMAAALRAMGDTVIVRVRD
jgi:hypothetical protein